MTTASKSLGRFPKQASGRTFEPDAYGIDVRDDVGAPSAFNGSYGIEIELEGVGLPQRMAVPAVNGTTWVPHVDNSLRNGGMEYVLSQPASLEDCERLLEGLFTGIRDAGGRIANTYRCSSHVHVNMRGVKVNGLAAFVLLWGMFEDVLVNWCGKDRAGNLFALRLRDSSTALDRWTSAFRNGDFNFSRDHRYLALNPAALGTFGSLEIRPMAGVASAAALMPWLRWIDAIRAAALTYENPSSVAADFSAEGPGGMFERVFGGLDTESNRALLAASDDFAEDAISLIIKGFRRCQPIAYALPWDDVLPEIKKQKIVDPFAPAVRPARARPRLLDVPLRRFIDQVRNEEEEDED